MRGRIGVKCGKELSYMMNKNLMDNNSLVTQISFLPIELYLRYFVVWACKRNLTILNFIYNDQMKSSWSNLLSPSLIPWGLTLW